MLQFEVRSRFFLRDSLLFVIRVGECCPLGGGYSLSRASHAVMSSGWVGGRSTADGLIFCRSGLVWGDLLICFLRDLLLAWLLIRERWSALQRVWGLGVR